jgi:hypothetical protein
MKTKIGIKLVVLLFMYSCSKPIELDGIWVSSYEYNNNIKTSPKFMLFDFEKDSLFIKFFEYKNLHQHGKIERLKFELLNKMLVFGSDTLNIDKIYSDSLVTYYFRNNYEHDELISKEKVMLVFKNINNYKKIENKNFKFINAKYETSSVTSNQNFILEFINDSTCLNYDLKNLENSSFWDYSFSEYKNFKFLIFDEIDSPPHLITHFNDKNDFSTKSLDLKEMSYNFKKISENNNVKNIEFGIWSTLDDFSLPIYIPNTSKDFKDKNIYFEFLNNKIIVKQFDIAKELIVEHYGNNFIVLKNINSAKREIWKFSHLENGNIFVKFKINYNSKPIEIELKKK